MVQENSVGIDGRISFWSVLTTLLYGNINTVKKNSVVRRYTEEVNGERTSYWCGVYVSSLGGKVKSL
jgi:hypothetical protein